MKAIAITAAIALLLGLGLGSQLFPKVKTEVVETEREVIKNNIVTVVKEVVKKDGSKETVTTTTDKSKGTKLATSTTKVQASTYHASLRAETDNITLSNITYSLQVERRILGDIFVGASISTDKKVGVSLGMDF